MTCMPHLKHFLWADPAGAQAFLQILLYISYSVTQKKSLSCWVKLHLLLGIIGVLEPSNNINNIIYTYGIYMYNYNIHIYIQYIHVYLHHKNKNKKTDFWLRR